MTDFVRGIEDHSHNFLPGAWPFAERTNAAVFTSKQVLDGSPILLVFHSHDGDWQFLHGPVDESDEALLICFGCAFDRDNAIGILAGMPIGWMAQRESPTSAWHAEPYEDECDE